MKHTQKKFLLAVLVCTGIFNINASHSSEAKVSAKEESKDKQAQSEGAAAQMTHEQMMVQLFGPAKKDIKTIGILVYEGVNSMDVIGPRYVLGHLIGATTQLIAVKPGNIKTVMGVELVPDATIDQIGQLDILVVPGGFEGTIESSKNEAVLDWIRKIDKTSQYTTSVCTGAWILANTGLLEGRNVSTNWFNAKEIMAKGGAQFTGERYTSDGKYWTSAGVSAGVDMSLAIVKEVRGEKFTQAVMLDMEYDPKPPIIGGTPEKTSPEVLRAVKGMYQMGLEEINNHE